MGPNVTILQLTFLSAPRHTDDRQKCSQGQKWKNSVFGGPKGVKMGQNDSNKEKT